MTSKPIRRLTPRSSCAIFKTARRGPRRRLERVRAAARFRTSPPAGTRGEQRARGTYKCAWTSFPALFCAAERGRGLCSSRPERLALQRSLPLLTDDRTPLFVSAAYARAFETSVSRPRRQPNPLLGSEHRKKHETLCIVLHTSKSRQRNDLRPNRVYRSLMLNHKCSPL